MNKFYCLVFTLFFFNTVFAEELTVLTEEYPPYQTQINGKDSGLSVEIVKALLKEVDIKSKIRFYPWARAWERALSEENILLFSVLRNSEREDSFHWIGPLTQINNCLFSAKEHGEKFTSIEEMAKTSPFRIGTVRDDVFEKYLTDLKYDLKKIERNNSHEANFKMLLLGRLDLWAVDEVTARYIAQSGNPTDPKKLYKTLCMDHNSENSIYMVLSKKTKPEIRDRLHKAFKILRDSPAYKQIIEKYRL